MSLNKILKTRQDKTRQDKTRQDKTRQDKLDCRLNPSSCQALFESRWQKCH